MRGNIDILLKTLEILGQGFHLKFERSKIGRRKIYAHCANVWFSIDRKQLYRSLERLKLCGVIKTMKEVGNIEKIVLTNRARAYSPKCQFAKLSLKKPKKRWDKQWRMVLFDIPEFRRRKRDALRKKLKDLGFWEFQKSIFVYPFPCRDEVNFVINFLDIAECVYYTEAPIAPDNKLRRHFNLM